MDEAQLRERARRSIEAFNRGDWDDIRARWAPPPVDETPPSVSPEKLC